MDVFGDSDSDSGDDDEERPSNCGVLSFHEGTEEAMVLAALSAPAGDVDAILKAIDDFCFRQHWMMHVGPEKSAILRQSLGNCSVACEIGTYCGYSALVLAGQGCRLYSFEVDERHCRIARKVIAHAHLTQRVTIVNADAKGAIDYLKKQGLKLEYLFIDHDERFYLKDLLLFEPLLLPGATVVADNVLFGKHILQDYLTHVRTHYKQTTLYRTALEYSSSSEEDKGGKNNIVLEDGLVVSILFPR